MWPEISSAKQENKRELSLNGDKFTDQLSKNDGKLDPTLFGLQQLNFLQLSNSALSEIPNDVVKLENISSMLLFGNRLSSLPGETRDWDFVNQQFNSFFSASIAQLHKLKILDVSNNQLTEFIFDLSNASQLSTINLCGNEITTFQLKSPTLHILDLSNNKISQFPEIPSTVTDLKMSKNQLEEIPDDMHLPNLKNLDLSENSITGIPKSLSALKLKSKCIG